MNWRTLKVGTLYYFLPAFIVLYFTFYPGLWTPFAHHDDLGMFDPEWVHNLIFHESSLGRPFFGIIDSLFVFPFVKSLKDISLIRMEIVIVLSMSLSVLALHLQRIGLPRFYAFSLALLIFLLPGAQQRVFHAISLPAVIAILLATISGVMISNINFNESLQPHKNKKLLAFALIFLTVSAYSYIPSTLFFLVVLSSNLLFVRKEDFVPQAFRFVLSSVFFSIWLVFTIIFYKFVILRALVKLDRAFGQNYGAGYKIEISRTIFSRIELFFGNWLPYEMKLWWLEWNDAQYLFGALIIGALLIASFIYIKKDPQSIPPFQIILSLFLLFGIIVFMNSPSFISDSGGAFARIMFTASAVLVLLLFWSLYKVFGMSKYFNIAILICIATSWYSAHQRFNESVKITKTEFDLVRAAVKKLSQSPSSFKEIIVISPTPGISYFGKSYFKDEFNSLNSHDHGEIVAMVHIVSEENLTNPLSFMDIHFVWDPQYFQSWYDSDLLWYSYGEQTNKMNMKRSKICHSNDIFLIYHDAVILNFGQRSMYKMIHDACHPIFQRVGKKDFIRIIQSPENLHRIRLDFLLFPDSQTLKNQRSF